MNQFNYTLAVQDVFRVTVDTHSLDRRDITGLSQSLNYIESKGINSIRYSRGDMYSETYAAASKALTVSGDNSGLTPDSNLLVWMVYDFHSCLTLIRKDGSWESGLLMSDTSVLNAFSEDYVTKMLRDFFITDAEVTMIKQGFHSRTAFQSTTQPQRKKAYHIPA